MESFWPLGSTFRIVSGLIEETWTVETETDADQGKISSQSPFGSFLLSTLPEQKFQYVEPSGAKVEYEVLGIVLPNGKSATAQDARGYFEIDLQDESLAQATSNKAEKLARLLSKISDDESLDNEDIDWLEVEGQFQVLAEYYERNFERSLEVKYASKASKYWRKADLPEKALIVTEGLQSNDSQEMSVLLTTRGGAYRDLRLLTIAEYCAQRAIRFTPSNYYPYNLLGAICYQSGRVEEGAQYFEQARELGSPQEEEIRQITVALKLSGYAEKQKVGQYLKLHQPEKYQELRRYFE